MERFLKIFALAASCVMLLAAVAVFRGTGDAEAQGHSIGFIDSDKVLENYAPAVEVNKQLANLRKQIEMDLEKTVREKYGPGDLSTLSREQQLEVQKMFDNTDTIFQQKSESLRQEKWVPIVDEINAAIEKVAMEEKLEVVLEKTAVIHGGVDLTQQVIDYLKTK